MRTGCSFPCTVSQWSRRTLLQPGTTSCGCCARCSPDEVAASHSYGAGAWVCLYKTTNPSLLRPLTEESKTISSPLQCCLYWYNGSRINSEPMLCQPLTIGTNFYDLEANAKTSFIIDLLEPITIKVMQPCTVCCEKSHVNGPWRRFG